MIASRNSPYPLRPLTAGEVLDRAVNLWLRNFWLLAALGALIWLPSAILTCFQSQSSTEIFRAIMQVISLPDAMHRIDNILRNAASPEHSGLRPALSVANFFLMLVYQPVATATLMSALAAIYLNRSASVSSALRSAVRSGPSLVGLILLCIVLVFVIIVPIAVVGIVLMIVFGLVIAAFNALHAPAIGGALVVAFWLVPAIGLAPVVFAWPFSLLGIIEEHCGPARAIVDALARLANPASYRGTLLVAFALNGLTALTTGLAELAAVLTIAVTNFSTAAGVAVWFFLLSVTVPLLSAVAVVSYFDIRVRREGFDLACEVGAYGTGG